MPHANEITMSRGVESLGLSPFSINVPWEATGEDVLASGDTFAVMASGALQAGADRLEFIDSRLGQLAAEGYQPRSVAEQRELAANTSPLPGQMDHDPHRARSRAIEAGYPLNFTRVEVGSGKVIHDHDSERAALLREREVIVESARRFEAEALRWASDRAVVYRSVGIGDDPSMWRHVAPEDAEIACLAFELGRSIESVKLDFERKDEKIIALLAGARQSSAFGAKARKVAEIGGACSRPPGFVFAPDDAAAVDANVRGKIEYYNRHSGARPALVI